MADNRIRLYMGTTGSGKTYLFCKHMKEEQPGGRQFIFDTMADEKLERYGVVCSGAADAVALAAKSGTAGPFHIRLQVDDPGQFSIICQAAMRLGNCCLWIDELSLFCNSQWIPEDFRKVIRLGRHRAVSVRATTQRPPDIQTLILSQTKEVYLFQMHLPNDIDYLNKFIPNVERCKTLTQGAYILWTPGTQAPPIPSANNLPETSTESVSLPLPQPLPDSEPTSET